MVVAKGAKKPYKCQRVGRITINGYLNFLRDFKRSHCGFSPQELVRLGAKAWNKLNAKDKECYRMMGAKAGKKKAASKTHKKKMRKSKSKKAKAAACKPKRKLAACKPKRMAKKKRAKKMDKCAAGPKHAMKAAAAPKCGPKHAMKAAAAPKCAPPAAAAPKCLTKCPPKSAAAKGPEYGMNKWKLEGESNWPEYKLYDLEKQTTEMDLTKGTASGFLDENNSNTSTLHKNITPKSILKKKASKIYKTKSTHSKCAHTPSAMNARAMANSTKTEKIRQAMKDYYRNWTCS